jgi:hypothetical protein
MPFVLTEILSIKYKQVPLNSLALSFPILRSHSLIVPSEDAEYTRFSSSGPNLKHFHVSNQYSMFEAPNMPINTKITISLETVFWNMALYFVPFNVLYLAPPPPPPPNCL